MKTKGFTLVELMVVISIVALLSSVSMYSTAQARMKADDAAKKSQVHQVETAIAIKKTATGKVPRNYNCSGTFCPGGTGGTVAVEGTQAYNASMQELVSGGYISAIPKSKDGSYVYYATPTADSAAFGAELQTGSVQQARNKCAYVPVAAPYTQCKIVSDGDTPYSDPNTVNFQLPETATFCSMYGSPTCTPNGNGLYANVCPTRMFPGGPCSPDVGMISCIADTSVVTTCAGTGNDFCACVE